MGAGCTSRTSNVINSTLSKKTIAPSSSGASSPPRKPDQPNPSALPTGPRNNNKNIKSLLDKAMEEDSQELGGNVLSESVNLDRLHHKIESELLKKNRDALFEAVEMNDTAAMERILQQENQFEEAALYSNEGESLLHRAALLGHIDALMLLIARTNARPDLLNYNLSTPLHVACRHNQEAIVRFLVGCGVDVNLQDQNGQTSLLVSCIHGNHGVMEFLIDASNSGHTSQVLEVERSDNRGLTPLNCLAIRGDLKMTKTLVEKGKADIEKPSPKGCTPLLYAARGGYTQIVSYLLKDRKANWMATDHSGGSVVHHAVQKRQINVLEALHAHGVDFNLRDLANRSPLFEAIENDDGSAQSRQTIAVLVESGALVDVTDCTGHTPLFCAVRSGNETLAHFLLQEGDANPNLFATNAELGQELGESSQEIGEEVKLEYEKRLVDGLAQAATPLHIASLLGMDELVTHLLKAGADPNLAANFGKEYPPLVFCMLGNKIDTAMILLKHGASPYIPDAEGKTLMDWLGLIDPMQKLDILDLIGDLKNQGIITNELPNPQSSVILEEEEYLESDQYIRAGVGVIAPAVIDQNDRAIKGISGEAAKQMFQTAEVDPEPSLSSSKSLEQVSDLSEFVREPGREKHSLVAEIFGEKVALAIVCQNQMYREMGVRAVIESYRTKIGQDEGEEIVGMGGVVLKACALVLNETLGDRVLKVFNAALELFSGIISSSKAEEQGLEAFAEVMTDCDLITKLIQKAEENQRQLSKGKEAMMDLCFHPQIGPGYVASFLNSRIAYHNKFDPGTTTDNEDPLNPSHSSQNTNGLLRCFIILQEIVSKFKLAKSGPFSLGPLLQILVPGVQHRHSKPIREVTLKIILELHKKGHTINISRLQKLGLTAQYVSQVETKLAKVKPIAHKDQKRMSDFLISQEQEDQEEEIDPNLMPRSDEIIKVATGEEEQEAQKRMQELKKKDWTEREIRIRKVRDQFQKIAEGNGASAATSKLKEGFEVILSSLEMKNLSIYLIAVETAKLFYSMVLDLKQPCISSKNLAQSASLIIPKAADSNTRVKKKSVEAVLALWKKSTIKLKELTELIASLVLDLEKKYKERGIQGRLSLVNYKLTEILESTKKEEFQNLFGCNIGEVLKFVNKYSQNHRNAKVRERAGLAVVQLAQYIYKTKNEQGRTQILGLLLSLKPAARQAILVRIQQLCEHFFKPEELERMQQKKQQQTPQKEEDEKQEEAKLPYTEELKPEKRKKVKDYLEAFGQEVVRCFFSSVWSCRVAALNFLKENIPRMLMNPSSKRHNFRNLFQTFCRFVGEALKDVVLKVFTTAVELIQTALPHFFREVQGSLLKTALEPVIALLFSKTKDVRPKCNEAAVGCMAFLAHQSPIGPQYMCEYVLRELEESQRQATSLDKAISNASFWTSALKLLGQFERVAQLCSLTGKKSNKIAYIEQFMKYTNMGLHHTSSSVRAAAVDLYITLFQERGREIETLLGADIKQVMRNKLTQATHHAKRDGGNDLEASTSQSLSMAARGDIYKHSLNYFKSGDAKRRMKGLIYVKKQFTIDSSFLQQGDQERARDLWESLTMVLRSLLSDQDVEIFLETLKLLQQGLQKLVSHLNAFDLLISMGSFLSTLIAKTTSSNMRMQMASDKMLITIAKTPEIGPALIVRDLAASLEKNAKGGAKASVLSEGQCNKMVGLVSSLLTQFPGDKNDFIQKGSDDLCGQTLSALGGTLAAYPDSQLLRTQVTQILTCLLSRGIQALVSKCVAKLEPTKRTPLNKILLQLKPEDQVPRSTTGSLRNDERESETSVSTSRKKRMGTAENQRPGALGAPGTLQELRSTTNSFFGGPVMASPVEKADVPEEEINEGAGSGHRGSAAAMSISQMRRSQNSFKGYDPSEGRKITQFKPEGGLNDLEVKPPGVSSLLQRLPDINKKNSSFLPPINPKSSSMTGRPGPLRPQKTDPFSSYTHGGVGASGGYDPLLLDKIPGIDIEESPPEKLSISQQRRINKKPPLYNVGQMNPLPEVEELSYSTSSMKSPHAVAQDDILNQELERADSRAQQLRKERESFKNPLSLDDILGRDYKR